MVRQIRKAVFGRSGPTHHWEQRYGHLDWASVDWANENNTTVGRRLMVQPSVVRFYRINNRKPICLLRESHEEVIDESKLEQVEWNLYADVEIGDFLGVCRERARQLRVERGQPECMVKNMSTMGRDATRWLWRNKESVEGKLVAEVIEMIPNLGTGVQNQRRILKASCAATGIKLNWKNLTHRHTGKYDHFNWLLPNSFLSAVWGPCIASVANFRHQNHKRKQKWHFGGFSLQMDDPEFKAEAIAEVQKALQKGVEVDLESIRLRYRISLPQVAEAAA